MQASANTPALWLTWFLVTVIATLFTAIIYQDERNRRLDEADQRLQIEVAYLAELLGTELGHGNFEAARSQVAAWGRLNPDIKRVRLIAQNGYVLAQFDRTMANYRLAERQSEIAYSYRGLASLRVEKSLEPVHASITEFGRQVFGALLTVELAVLVFLFQFLRYRRQVILTEQEYEQKLEAQEALRHMATSDALTGLPNRYMLDEQLWLRVREAERFKRQLALLFIDLDNFKTVNDSFGHDAGDQLLKTIAERISTCLRGYDLIARFGGDEFVVVISNIESGNDIEQVANKITAVLEPAVALDGQQAFVSASIGISLFPEDGKTPGDLLRKADAAMYTAKEAGRNCYRFYTEAMNATVAHRHQIEVGLHRALRERQLYLVYQPQIDMHTGEIRSCEALLRWDSEHGPVPPAEFIPVAEQSPLMKQLQAFVIDEALRQRAAWLRDGLADLRVDLNISGGRIAMNELFDQLESARQRHALNHSHFGIELTEHSLMEASDSCIEQLAMLRARGMNIALDDFGTGYSSLGYLKRLPVDTLKIDRTFVNDLPDDELDRAIVGAIVAMGKNLGKQTLAEGIETQTQLDFILGLGCDMAQGYLFHRPMSAAALQAIIAQSGSTLAPFAQTTNLRKR